MSTYPEWMPLTISQHLLDVSRDAVRLLQVDAPAQETGKIHFVIHLYMQVNVFTVMIVCLIGCSLSLPQNSGRILA